VFTHYENVKGDEKCRNWWFGGLGVTQDHQQHNHSIERIRLLI